MCQASIRASTISGSPGFVIVILFGFFAVASAQLPPEILADRYLMRAERLVGEKDYAGARDLVNRIADLQGKHALALPDSFHFKYVKVAWSAGAIPVAVDALNRYLAGAGTAGEHYREALVLLETAELMMPIEPEMVVIPAGRFRMGSVRGVFPLEHSH